MVLSLTINPCDSVENVGYCNGIINSNNSKSLFWIPKLCKVNRYLKVREYQENVFRFLLFLWELLQHYEYKASSFLKELSPQLEINWAPRAEWQNKEIRCWPFYGAKLNMWTLLSLLKPPSKKKYKLKHCSCPRWVKSNSELIISCCFQGFTAALCWLVGLICLPFRVCLMFNLWYQLVYAVLPLLFQFCHGLFLLR